MIMKGTAILAWVLGIVFLGLALIYFITPANSLPSFLPGYDPTLTKVHFKHGVGSLLLALAIFAFAWFNSGKNHLKK